MCSGQTFGGDLHRHFPALSNSDKILGAISFQLK
jgi:hypothetical protein